MDIARANRMAFVLDRLRKGWSGEVAGPVSWALIPFDDSPVPPRSLEKNVRKRCKSYARELREVQNDQFASLDFAISVANDYVNLAKEANAPYFVDLWENLRDQAESARPL